MAETDVVRPIGTALELFTRQRKAHKSNNTEATSPQGHRFYVQPTLLRFLDSIGLIQVLSDQHGHILDMAAGDKVRPNQAALVRLLTIVTLEPS